MVSKLISYLNGEKKTTDEKKKDYEKLGGIAYKKSFFFHS